jgi:nitric oxide dioxygenase
MLNTIVEKQPKREVTFIHGTANSQTHAFKEQVKQLTNNHQNVKLFVVYDAPTEADRTSQHFDKEGYVDLNFLQSIIPSKEANFYFCGSIPFMEAINRALNQWGVPKDRIHYEVFSPLAILGEK